MKHQTSALLLLGVLLVSEVTPRAAVKFATGEPMVLDDDAGYLELLPEAEFRQAARQHTGEEGFVPLKACPTGLSSHALFDRVPVPDRTVTLAVDGVPREGYRVVADLNADGDLRDDSPWPMERRKVEVWDFTGARMMKDAWVAEVDSVVQGKPGAEGSHARVKFRVTFTGDTVQFPNDPRPRPQALFAQSTLRKGMVSGLGRGVAFALRGVGGIYDDDFNAVLFDLNGDGKWNPANRASSEYFWVWERKVKLNGTSYEFSVDRHGRTLTLKPLTQKLPERPSLEVGQPAPDFAFLDFEGKKRRLSDYRGKVVLLDFWGTWCPGSVVHAKELVDAYRRLHEKGFEILGVHGGGKEEEVRKFVAEHGMSWPQTMETGEIPRGRPLQKLYRFFGVPNYFLVNRDGTLLTNDVHQPALLIEEAERRLSSPGPGRPPAPVSGGEAAGDHSREYRFKLSPESFAAVFGFDGDGVLDYSIPRSRVFERGGGLVLDLKEPKGDLSKLLDQVLKEPKSSNARPTLSEELSRLQGDHGRPVRASDLGRADLSVVEYEAEWCYPCKRQLKKFREFAAANRAIRVNLVRVEADLAKLSPEMQKKLVGSIVEAPKEKSRAR